KAKVGLSANKVMATVFWDARGVIHIDYLQKGRTMNGEYYTSLLDRFNEDLKKKRPPLAKKKVLFHQESIHVLFPWRNFTNYAMNCSLIRRILQI
ncbi:Mariner transposase, partial [Caligus rogercresseyi]